MMVLSSTKAASRAGLILLLLVTSIHLSARAAEIDLAARVIILANRDSADSERLARHYAEKRGVPKENIFAFKMPTAETITWPQFVTSIWQPLQDELVRRQWLDAVQTSTEDFAGRRKIATHSHRISYLVVCRGVPLRVHHDPELMTEVPGLTNRKELRTTHGAIDSELALLPTSGLPVAAYVPNPLFRDERPLEIELARVIKVSRLDGPSYEAAAALVDHAIEGERTGLLGRAYVDIGGIHADGDRWFEMTAQQIATLGFSHDVDRDRSTLAAAARFDAPVLYFGWYASRLNGPMALPEFQFPPGAIALHLHSYSATSLRSATNGWTAPLVAHGVTATVGNVFEPYLYFTHQPQLLLRALARGWTWGDAACYSISVLSWQGVAVGDPLYRPFGVGLDEQLSRIEELPPSRAGYALLRRARLLDAEGKPDEALALLRRSFAQNPSLPLAYEIATRLRAADDLAGASEVLGSALPRDDLRTDEWGLARGIAHMLQEIGARDLAVSFYEKIFASAALPRELRLIWLREAREIVIASGANAKTRSLDEEIEKLNVPAPGKK